MDEDTKPIPAPHHLLTALPPTEVSMEDMNEDTIALRKAADATTIAYRTRGANPFRKSNASEESKLPLKKNR